MSRVDPSTFSWVKDEIDESIKQARLSLEAFSTATDDTSQMRMAVAFLHQVSGTLQIVELDGAARLVSELELVGEGLIDESIQPSEETLDALSRGVLSLSTYISQLHAGYPDSIVSLAPLINELRAARKTEPVSELDLFNPVLDIYPESSTDRPRRLSDEEFISEANQARKQLLSTMVKWFSDKDDKQALNTILLLFQHLKNISRFDITSQLWWIASALAESLRDGGLDSTNKENRRYFAALEQELKRIVEQGESALVKSPREQLLKNMLYLIARSNSSGPVKSEVSRAFELAEQVSRERTSEAPEIFEATSPDVIKSIMRAISDELAITKDKLNEYFDEENTEANSIEPLVSSLDKVRGAVEVINKKKLLGLVEEISHTALAHDADTIVIKQNIAMDLAEAILTLEDACSELDDPSADWEEKVDRAIADLHWIRTGEHLKSEAEGIEVEGIDVDEEGTLSDVEYAQLMKVVASEISSNLQDVVEKFEKYSLNMHLNEILKPIPDKLRQIEGALQILDRSRAIELVTLITEQISGMATGEIKPSTEHVETTALAISAIESYAQSLQHDQPTSDLIIERAMEEMLRTAPSVIIDKISALDRVIHIRDEADEWLRNPEDKLHLATLRKDMAAIIALAKSNKDEKLEKIADEVSRLVSMLSQDPEFLTDDIMTTFHQSLTILEKLTGQLPEDLSLVEPAGEEVIDVTGAVEDTGLGIELEELATETTEAEPGEQAVAEEEATATENEAAESATESAPAVEILATEDRQEADFDDEILDIFLEEAREISVNSKDLLNKWSSNPADEAALTELRRGFHTLKGSGRMSGAVEFGEVAWLMEQMLNNVISGKLEANVSMFALLDEVIDKLPSMLDDLQKHDESNIDVGYWEANIASIIGNDEESSEAEAASEADAAPEEDEQAIEEEIEAMSLVEDGVQPPETQSAEHAAEEESDLEKSVEMASQDIEETESVPGFPAPLQSETVREIYTAEISKHLEELAAELNSYREQEQPEVSDVMHRVIHTLRGSARSVGLEDVADTYESVENLLDGLSARSLYLKDDDLEILQKAHDLGMHLHQLVSDSQPLEEEFITSLKVLSENSATRLSSLPNPQMHDGTVEMPSYFRVEEQEEADESTTDEAVDAAAENLADELSDDIVDTAAESAKPGDVTEEEGEEQAELPEEAVVEKPLVEEAEEQAAAEMSAEKHVEVPADSSVETPADEVVDDAVDELVEIFREEAIDLLSRFHDSLSNWRNAPDDEQASSEIKRIFHTIKGSARMAGINSIGDLAHNTETLLDQSDRTDFNVNEDLFDLIEEIHDTLQMMVEQPTNPDNAAQAAEMNQRIREIESAEQPAGEELSIESAEEETAQAVEEVHAEETAGEEPHAADEMADELVEIFREEAIDLLSRFHDSLSNWRNAPDDEQASSEIKRIFHTIKGSARMAGISTIGDLAHNTESLLDLSERGDNKVDDNLFELIEEVHDTLQMMVENPLDRSNDDQAAAMNQTVLAFYEQPAGEVEVTEEKAAPTAEQQVAAQADDVAQIAEEVSEKLEELSGQLEKAPAAVEPAKKSAVPEARKGKQPAAKQAQVRVDSDLLSTLANYAGEVSIARSRIQQQVSNFKENLSELHANIERFQTQIRELEIQADSQILSRSGAALNEKDEDFDPLEFDRYTQLQFLSRNLAESLHDLMMIQTGMDNFAGDVELLLHEQSRLNTDLQEGLTQTRMVAFTTLMPRLRQLSRKTSRELHKPIDLELVGGEVELDRNIIDQVVPPLEHLIRNSIAHGIEDVEARKKLGKPEKGLLKLDISREGKDVIIEFSDDGQGLDLDKIRNKAEEKGLLDRGMNPSDDHLANLIFVPGFSTADSISLVSGRGVGMDVVQSELKQIGGSVSLTTERHKGTRFIVRLPLSMTVAQAMIISSGGQRFAVPLMSIQSITMVIRSRIVTDETGEQSVTIGENQYPYMSLAERMGMLAQLEDENKIPALILNTATGSIVVGVDELIHATEIVVKPVGSQVASLDGIEGATVLGDGRVSLIIDLVDLWNTRHAERSEIDQASLVAKLEKEVAPATIMVVDDSLTVRRVTERNLSKYGIDTILATDGVDALEKLPDGIPDVMLVDIEMPRMDGFELTERVRDDPVYRDIPIIIITSRSGPKHRDRAMELGATLYLTKPYQELELMNAINSVLPLESSRKISAMMEA